MPLPQVKMSHCNASSVVLSEPATKNLESPEDFESKLHARGLQGMLLEAYAQPLLSAKLPVAQRAWILIGVTFAPWLVTAVVLRAVLG